MCTLFIFFLQILIILLTIVQQQYIFSSVPQTCIIVENLLKTELGSTVALHSMLLNL